MRVSVIVAIGTNRQIGLNNQLLWHIPKDFKNFKSITMGHHMVMGRKTFESIGRPLPGRTTIIITRDEKYKMEGCVVAHSLNGAIEFAKAAGDRELFICGGESVYREGLSVCDRLYLSKVDYNGDADVYFPEYEQISWTEVETASYPKNEKTPYSWTYHVLDR